MSVVRRVHATIGLAVPEYLFFPEPGQRAGLDRQEPPIFVTPHILRHTWLYMLCQKGISAEIRAELACHSLETTMKHGKPKRPEIERAVTVLDDAATV